MGNGMEEMIDVTALYQRRLIRDLTPCGEVDETFDVFGLSRSSDEMDVLEHRDSHLRLEMVEKYEARVEAMSEICADVLMREMFIPEEICEMDEEYLRTMKAVYSAMIATSSLTIMANLVADELGGVNSTAMRRAR
jgi:hypothetical protein